MEKWNVMKLVKLPIAALLLVLAARLETSAQVLMLDFGPTTVTNTSPTFDATISPAHEDGGLSTSVATWNQIQLTDVGSGLLYGNGTSATGVSLNLGIGTALSNVDFDTNPGTTLTGTNVTSGVFSDTRAARDGIFNNASGTIIGVQVSGLAAGQYQIFMMGRNTNAANFTGADFYGASGVLDGNNVFNFTGSLGATIAASASPTTSSFVANNNYGTFNVTLDPGETLLFAVDAIGGETRPFLNYIQIVAVPEPSTQLLLLAGFGGLLFLRRWKSA